MHEQKVNTTDGETSSPEGKKNFRPLKLAQAGQISSVKRRPRRDLQIERNETRDRMLHQVDFVFRMMASTFFRPVDSKAPRGILDPAPADNFAMRLHPSVEVEVNELRRQMVDLVRRASMVRGPAARQALHVIAGGEA